MNPCPFHPLVLDSQKEITSRIDQFLFEYRDELASMPKETFAEHLVGLAKIKLQIHNSLEEETSQFWYEIAIGRYDWEVHRNEALSLRGITMEDLLSCYDEHFLSWNQGK